MPVIIQITRNKDLEVKIISLENAKRPWWSNKSLNGL